MATAATVTIRMDADSARLVAELQKAERAAKGTFSNITREAQQMAAGAAAAAAAAGVAAAAAAAALAAQSFKSIDALAKTADRLGMATQAMKTFQVAADLAGVSQETLEKSLLKQQKALAGAVDGNGELRRTFQELGVDARAVMDLPVDQQFDAIAAALENVDNVTRRNALAMEVWGARGIEMVNLGQQGTQSIGELRQTLEDMNVTVSRFDAAKIEQANDAVSLAARGLEGVGNSIAIAVAPIVQGLAEEFVEVARRTNGFRETIETAMTVAVRVIGAVADVVHLVTTAITTALRKVGEFLLSIPGVREGIDAAGQAARGMLDSWMEAGASARDYWADAFNTTLPSTAIDDWLARAKAKAEAGAAETAARMRAAIEGAGGGGGGGLAPLEFGSDERRAAVQQRSVPIADLNLGKLQVPNGDANAIATREYTEIATQQYLEAWQLANEQRVLADQALKDTLFQSDQEAGRALIELAAEQAREKVLAEFEARGVALDETGQIADPEKRVEFEAQVQDETLKREAEFLDRRLALQRQFGSQYTSIQGALQKLFGKSWADTHKKTLQDVTTFAASAQSIATALFGQNKKVAIANALINTFVGVSRAFAEHMAPASFAVAAAVLASGLAQVRSIQGTSTSGGGASGSVGSAVGGGGGLSAASPASSPAAFGDRAAQGERVVQLVIQGDLIGWDQHIEQRVIGSIREAVSERDVIILDPRSRNARDLVGG